MMTALRVIFAALSRMCVMTITCLSGFAMFFMLNFCSNCVRIFFSRSCICMCCFFMLSCLGKEYYLLRVIHAMLFFVSIAGCSNMVMTRCAVRFKKGHVEEVYIVTEDQQCSSKANHSEITLCTSLYKEEQRENKVNGKRQENSKLKVTFIKTTYPVVGFFRNVGEPLQHELIEPYVSPEDRETEQQFS